MKNHLLSITLFMFCAGWAGAQGIGPSVIASSGGSYSGQTFSMDYTVGETFISTLSGGNFILTQGFHQPEALVVDDSTVMDIISNSPVHNTLQAAIEAAELVDALNGTGPFTVFAPTDAAFEALPAGTLAALLADPAGQLTQILLYHVIGAQVLSSDLVSDVFVSTLNGDSIYVNINDNGVFIDNAQVVVVDLLADNGVVHVIDAVILPGTNEFIDGCTNMEA